MTKPLQHEMFKNGVKINIVTIEVDAQSTDNSYDKISRHNTSMKKYFTHILIKLLGFKSIVIA